MDSAKINSAVAAWKEKIQHLIFSKHFPYPLHEEPWRPIAISFFLGLGLSYEEIKETITELERNQLYWHQYTDQ